MVAKTKLAFVRSAPVLQTSVQNKTHIRGVLLALSCEICGSSNDRGAKKHEKVLDMFANP